MSHTHEYTWRLHTQMARTWDINIINLLSVSFPLHPHSTFDSFCLWSCHGSLWPVSLSTTICGRPQTDMFNRWDYCCIWETFNTKHICSGILMLLTVSLCRQLLFGLTFAIVALKCSFLYVPYARKRNLKHYNALYFKTFVQENWKQGP